MASIATNAADGVHSASPPQSAWELRSLSALMAAEIVGLDLTEPLDAESGVPATVDLVEHVLVDPVQFAILLHYAVLVDDVALQDVGPATGQLVA